MKKHSILALIFTLFFIAGSFAQSLNPPRNLIYSVEDQNDTYLFWNQPAGDNGYIHWDNNFNDGSFEIEDGEYYCTVRWDTVNLHGYDGWKIKKMRFFIVNPAEELKLAIWKGDEPQLVFTQDINEYNIGDWTEVVLDSVINIDAAQELRAGLFVKTGDTSAVVGVDNGPVIDGYGNIYFVNGSWQTQIAGNWNIQLFVESPPQPVYLHWDNNHTDNYFGFFTDGYRQYSVAAKWNPEHLTNYNNWKLTSVKYVIQDAGFYQVKLKIWEGSDKTEVYSQDITDYNSGDWTETQLDQPFTIDASKDILVGIYIKTMVSGFPIGVDTSQLVEGQGFWLHYKLNGQWQWYEGSDPLVTVYNNVNIRIHLEPDQDEKNIDELLGYNVYRNGVLLNPSPVTPTSYVDMNLNNGSYEYKVTAVYDEGESQPCQPVSVTISQPAILEQDSLALVDLYNQCDGENWFYNDLWLEGPVNEWAGVVTDSNRVTGLFLSGIGVKNNLPESLGNLTALRDLILENNYYLTGLPESIGNMDSLRRLLVPFTQITSIPESIGNLTKLESLNLTALDLSENNLPETFGNLSNLKTLGISLTGITQLPFNFGNLDSLQNLFCSNNNLTSLPDNFGNLHNLEYLLLNDNQLTSLPENFGELSKLYILYLDNNQLTELPENFGNLSSLYYLILGGNMLNSLPDNFGNLSHLSIFYVDLNNLSELPESFGNLSTLDTLSASLNVISSLPESFGNLNDMSLCNLSKNSLNNLPESICNLQTIQFLLLHENQLTSLPENIGALKSLKLLGAAVNNLESIPVSVTTMDSLETLNLNINNISEIPESIGNMTSLQNLGLSGNNISQLPESLGELDLMAFTVNDNKLTELPETMFDNVYHQLFVQNNNLQFGSIEPLPGIVVDTLNYSPQKKIGSDTTILLEEGSEFTYTIDVSGNYNNYRWLKNGEVLDDENTNTLHIESLTVADQGTYVLEVTNTMISDLTLTSYDINLSVSTDVENKTLMEFKVFPNPVREGYINLILDEYLPADIFVFDINGKKVVQLQNQTGKVKIDVNNLTKGIYFISVRFKNGDLLSRKVVVE